MKQPDAPLFVLARAAIRMAEAMRSKIPNDDELLQCHRDLREASVAYRDALSPHDIARIGFGEKTLAR